MALGLADLLSRGEGSNGPEDDEESPDETSLGGIVNGMRGSIAPSTMSNLAQGIKSAYSATGLDKSQPQQDPVELAKARTKSLMDAYQADNKPQDNHQTLLMGLAAALPALGYAFGGYQGGAVGGEAAAQTSYAVGTQLEKQNELEKNRERDLQKIVLSKTFDQQIAMAKSEETFKQLVAVGMMTGIVKGDIGQKLLEQKFANQQEMERGKQDFMKAVRDSQQNFQAGMQGQKQEFENKLSQTKLSQEAQQKELDRKNRMDIARLRTSAAGNKPPTPDQYKSNEWATGMQQAEQDLQDLYKSGYRPEQKFDSVVRQMTPNMFKNENQKRFEQAISDWASNMQASRSGRPPTPQQLNSMVQRYMPQPGDTPGVLKQKANQRQLEVQGLQKRAGKAYGGAGGSAHDLSDEELDAELGL